MDTLSIVLVFKRKAGMGDEAGDGWASDCIRLILLLTGKYISIYNFEILNSKKIRIFSKIDYQILL